MKVVGLLVVIVLGALLWTGIQRKNSESESANFPAPKPTQQHTPKESDNQWLQDLWDRGSDLSLSAAKKGWDLIQKEGAPAAEKIMKANPFIFKDLEEKIGALSKSIGPQFEPKSIEEKKKALAELWRMKSTLDIASKVSPESLKAKTGIDVKQLDEMKKKFQSTVDHLKESDPKTFGDF